MKILLETERLALREWQTADLQPFIAMNADPAVMRYFPKTLSADETRQFYDAIQAEMETSGYGLYATEVKETGEFIGFIGFHKAAFEASFTPCIEIGWRLKQTAWRVGYATEGAKACLAYGFSSLGFAEVYSFTAELNQPSYHVMKKLGMQFVEYFDHPRIDPSSPIRRHVLYHIQC